MRSRGSRDPFAVSEVLASNRIRQVYQYMDMEARILVRPHLATEKFQFPPDNALTVHEKIFKIFNFRVTKPAESEISPLLNGA